MGDDSRLDINDPNRGNTVIRAKQINMDSVKDVYTNQSEQKFKQSGLTVSVSNSLVDSAKSIDNLIDAGGNTGSTRMKGMASVAAALKTKSLAAEANNAGYDLLDGNLKGMGNTRIQATWGTSKSQSNSSSYTEQNQASNITTNNLALIATGAGTDSNIDINGSNLNVTNDALFQADNDLNINGVAQNSNTRSDNKSSSAAIGGFADTTGSAGITVSASGAKGYANSDSTTYANSQINVGGTTTLDIGNDLSIKGGVINTGKAQGTIGGNTTIESLQDTATYDSDQKNMGFSADLDLAKGAGSSLSVNGGKTNVNADYQAVGEQSGIFTGDGSIELTTEGTTNLIGGAITTTDKALQDGLNNYVSKGGITTQDIENTTSYEGDAISAGVSIGNTTGKPQATMNGIGYGTDSDSDSSITRAGITGVAGNSSITTDNRAEYAGILENNFDAGQVNEELGAQVEITQAFDQERRKVKTEINKKEQKLRDEAEEQGQLGNTTARDKLIEQADKVQNQGLLFDAISGAIYGPNSNGATGYVAKVTSPQIAFQIGQAFKGNDLENRINEDNELNGIGSPQHLLAHTILGAAVSYATSNDAMTGGIAAGTGEAVVPLLSHFLYQTTDASTLTPEQKDTISAITSVLGAGIGLTTGNASDAVNAAETNKVAIEDNYLSESQDRSYSVLVKSTDFLRKKSKENEEYLVKICEASPSSKSCQTAIQDSLWYNSESALKKRIADGDESSKRVLDILYNGKNAENNFLSRVPDIDSRANFFGANDSYYDGKGVDIRWFGGAEDVSRSCITGLGANGCLSYATFGMSKILGNPDIYGWRSEAGNTLIKDGYSNFKSLYNGQYSNPKNWDIQQLRKEQESLQPVHEKYLKDYPLFRNVSEKISDVDILNKDSRIEYGCKLLGYDKAQGCKP